MSTQFMGSRRHEIEKKKKIKNESEEDILARVTLIGPLKPNSKRKNRGLQGK
jgi:hypothetical protein